MTFNQNFVPGWNAIYANLIKKVSLTIITSNQYLSPFSQMLQNMEAGEYVEDIHINLGTVLLQDTVTNSDIFTDYVDDIATSFYETNVDLAFPSTYTEYVVKTSFTMLENVGALISALTANIRTTMEFWRTKLVKQLLYNGYHYGMISGVTIADPRATAENSGKFIVTLNTLIDDFMTEINNRNNIYNNQVGITESEKRMTIASDFPYVIIFNEYVRDAEFLNALRLGLVEKFKSKNSNMDWQERFISLNLADFPTSIPDTNRSDVTGVNQRADNVNFFEMPTDENGIDLFSGEPLAGDNICAFVVDPAAIKLYTQLAIHTEWLNPASLRHTNREIYRGIMQLGAFNKICAVTF